MATSLLEEELKDLEDKRIIIVMDDGLGFLGKLKDFDRDTLLLEDVYQSSAKKINWETIEITDIWRKKTIVKDLSEKKKPNQNDKSGSVEWIKVNLERLYIRMEHILRIWYETELEEKNKPPTGSTVYSKE